MAIYTDARGGTLIIERRIFGRPFRRATGAPNTAKGRDLARGYEQMLLAFRDAGRGDLIEALRDPRGSLHFADCYRHYKRGEWERLPSPAHFQRLFPVDGDRVGAVGRWLPSAKTRSGDPVSDHHREGLRQSWRQLEKLAPAARIAELPSLLTRYRERCAARGHGRMFTRVRAAVQSFVRETQGRRRSLLWAEVTDVPGLAHERDVMLARSVEEAMAIRRQLSAEHRRVWWDECLTGMMPGEHYGRRWRVEGAGVVIRGTKTEYRDRVVPLLGAGPAMPLRRYQAYRLALKRIDPRLTPYVARRTYIHWLEEAEINPTRRRLYAGHAARDPHELYLAHDVQPHLMADGAQLADYLRRHHGTPD